MSYKEMLHDSIDIFFRETVEGVMRDNYGIGWLEKELLPQMRAYVQSGENQKVVQKYEDFLKRRKTFEFADATLCSAILIYDSKYSGLMGREIVENFLKKLMWFRNQCAHNGGNDISFDLYMKGTAKLKETILKLPISYYSVNLLNTVGVPCENRSNRGSNYTNSYAQDYEDSDDKIRKAGVYATADNSIRDKSNRKRESIRVGFLLWLILSCVIFICGVVITVRTANVVTKEEMWKLVCAFAVTYFVILLPWGYVKCGGGLLGWILGLICAAVLAVMMSLVSLVLVFVFAIPGTIIGRIADFFARRYIWQKILGNDLPVLLCYGLFIVIAIKAEDDIENLLDHLFEVKDNKGKHSRNRKREEKIEKRILISCEGCRQTLRVPVMKKRIMARCPKCNKEFMVKRGKVMKR